MPQSVADVAGDYDRATAFAPTPFASRRSIHSLSASSIRVCQPSPVARKRLRTSPETQRKTSHSVHEFRVQR